MFFSLTKNVVSKAKEPKKIISYGFDISMDIMSGHWKIEFDAKLATITAIVNAVYHELVNIETTRPPNITSIEI